MGYFLYKCRRCGEVDDSTGISWDRVLDCLLLAIKNKWNTEYGSIPIRINSIHTCKDGSYGITDLIGVSQRD